jgi:predicted DNA-binding protein (UPF0251 family)
MSPLQKVRTIGLKKDTKLKYHNTNRKQSDIPPISINFDGLEAMRLFYYQKLTQGKCAQYLGISQPTFSRILKKSQELLIKAIVEGKDFQADGGKVRFKKNKDWACWTFYNR